MFITATQLISRLIRGTVQQMLSLACLGVIAMLPLSISAQDDVRVAAESSWVDAVQPILQSACLDCHTGDDADGSLDLSQFETVDQVVGQRRLWSKIASRVRDQQMPPEDGPELPASHRQQLLDWIDQTLPQVPCSHRHHAGSVTIRRLTRFEYANTVRELLGIEYATTGNFPADGVGYGFDNIGDVLSISPLLFEKYLSAAETISEQLIHDPAGDVINVVIAPGQLERIRGGRPAGRLFVLTTTGTTTTEVQTKRAGRYQIQVDAAATQAGDEPAQMAISVNGRVIDEIAVRATPDEPEVFSFAARLDEGRNRIGVSFTNDFYDPENPDRSRRDRNLGIRQVQVSGPTDPFRPSRVQREFLFVVPDDSKTPRQCAEEIIALHGSRAFRRKLTPDDTGRLLEIFDLGHDNGESFESAMRLVIQSMLVSPNFLFRIEQPAPSDGSPRELSNYELATALSYFLWSSMPDHELFRTATRGELTDPVVLEAEVRRMLHDPKSAALFDNFAEQWLQLRVLRELDLDPEQYPGFTGHLRDSMIQETTLLLRDVFRNDLPLSTLLSADYTFVNKTLAGHYGWSTRGLKTREFSRVSLDGTPRRGLLSHGSFLTLTSNPTRTSPVKRGKWVLENLLADPPPPPSPDVPALDAQTELTGTLRERMEQHRADPNCAACHYKMDALGFALENFDASGRYRTMAEGKPIDASGELPGGIRFDSVTKLQAAILDRHHEQFVRCIVEKLFIYALGRGPQPTDDCVIDAIARKACKENQGFSDIILAIAGSEPFRTRSAPMSGQPEH